MGSSWSNDEGPIRLDRGGWYGVLILMLSLLILVATPPGGMSPVSFAVGIIGSISGAFIMALSLERGR